VAREPVSTRIFNGRPVSGRVRATETNLEGRRIACRAALHQVSERELPLTLAGAGLPQLPALTGAAKSYAEGCSASRPSTGWGSRRRVTRSSCPPKQKASSSSLPPPVGSSPRRGAPDRSCERGRPNGGGRA
jgi:hypothetical protein